MTRKWPLLAVMWTDAGDDGVLTGSATGPTRFREPVHMAPVGAEVAIGQSASGFNGPGLQCPAAMQCQ